MQPQKTSSFFSFVFFICCSIFCLNMAVASANDLSEYWHYKEVLKYDTQKEINNPEIVLKEVKDKKFDNWKQYKLVQNKVFPLSLEVTQLWLTNTIKYDVTTKKVDSLLFMTDDSAVNVWLDGHKIYSFADITSPPKGKHWHRINFPPLHKDAELTIQLSSNTRSKLGNFSYFKFDDTKNLTGLLFFFGVPILVSIPVCFIIISIIIFYFFQQNSWQKLHLASIIYLSNLALWMLLKSVLFHLYICQNIFTYWLEFITMVLLPITANYVGYLIIEAKYKKYFKQLNYFWVAFLILTLILELVETNSIIRIATNAFYVFIGLSYPVILTCLYKSYKRGNKFSLGLLIPVIITVFLGIFDGLNIQGRLTYYYSYLVPLSVYGVIYFLIVTIRSQLRNTVKNQKMLINLEHKKMMAQYHLEHDTLTGCMNRNKFIEDIKEFIKKAEQEDTPLAYFIFDIDHFKSINDDLGHKAGDDVLRNFAQKVTETMDKNKFFYRWGGEEFILICPKMTLEQAINYGELIREKIKISSICPDRTITVSIGISMWNKDDDSHEAVFKRADKAMFNAKENGRDKVVAEI